MSTLFNAFVKNISFPIISKRNGLPGLMSHLKRLEESQYWTRDRIREYQFKKVKALFVHAFNHTEFYKQRFNEAGFDPHKIHHLSELKKIPLLDKNQIRDSLKSLIARNFDPIELHSSETGGTTGVKMKFYRDNACLSPKEAALYRFEKWAGWEIGEKMGLVWTAQQDYVGHWTAKAKIKNQLFGRQVVFPAAVMNEENIARFVDKLIKKKPVMIRAFTSPLYEVARYMLENRIDLRLKGVITTGEPLYDHQRNIISKALNCAVFDSYRSREAGPLAQECEKHNGLHINAESLYVEAVPPADPQNFEKGMREIVITDLLNYGMPLIRYKIGDMGILSDAPCSCGRGLPILKRIAGRSSDILYTPERKRITAGSLVLYLVDEAPGLLGQVQIIQDRFEHLIFRSTPDPPLTQKIIDYEKRTIKRLFGEKMNVSFETVNDIPNEKSGKYLFTKCLLTQDEIK